jgi:hypothetical protein
MSPPFLVPLELLAAPGIEPLSRWFGLVEFQMIKEFHQRMPDAFPRPKAAICGGDGTAAMKTCDLMRQGIDVRGRELSPLEHMAQQCILRELPHLHRELDWMAIAPAVWRVR